MKRKSLYGSYVKTAEAVKTSSSFKFNVPEVKPMPLKTGALIFGGVAAVGLGMGAAIGTYVFFGMITLAGLIALIESNKYLRYGVQKGSYIVDIALFIATIYATAALGVTITASLTVAGLGYTLVYAPWLRQRTIK